jgi:hypothetical protein
MDRYQFGILSIFIAVWKPRQLDRPPLFPSATDLANEWERGCRTLSLSAHAVDFLKEISQRLLALRGIRSTRA